MALIGTDHRTVCWRPSIGLAVLFFSKTSFWPFYCQISTDLDKILNTPIVVRNTLVSRLRPRSACERLQAKPERLCFCNTCNVPYVMRRRIAAILAANRRSVGEDGCSREKCRNFVGWVEPDPKQNFFAFRRPCAQPIGNSFTPNRWYRGKPILKLCLLLVWSVFDQAFGRYRHMKGVEKWWPPLKLNIYITYRHTAHVENSIDSKNAFRFDQWRKITKLSRKTRFRIVASPGACECLVVFSWRSSSIYPSSYYCCCRYGLLYNKTAWIQWHRNYHYFYLNKCCKLSVKNWFADQIKFSECHVILIKITEKKKDFSPNQCTVIKLHFNASH